MAFCSKCGGPNERRTHGYCLACHAAYMREWRKTHPLTREQKRKDSSRSYANVYKRRGKLVPQPCEACGTVAEEMHHEDYDRPLDVRWFCRPCHIDLHYGPRRPSIPVRKAA